MNTLAICPWEISDTMSLVFNIEKILFSCWVFLCTSFFSIMYKKRKLVVTSEQIFLLNNKNECEVR